MGGNHVMTREEKIAVLMKDRCTKKEAERFLMEGTSIFESKEFEQHFDLYMDERFPRNQYDSEERQEWIRKFKEMMEHGTAVEDWGIVEDEHGKYYIEYVY